MVGAHQSNPLDWNPHKPLGNLVRQRKTENGEKSLRTGYLYRERIAPNRTYVGQTDDEERRRKEHNSADVQESEFHSRIRELRKDAGMIIPIHEFFDYRRLFQRILTQSDADFYERALIFHFNAYPGGYVNSWNGGCSEKTKRKLKESRKGKTPSKGVEVTQETRRKLSVANKGRINPFTQEHCRNISKSKKGKKPSEKTKQIMANKAIGNQNGKGKSYLSAVKNTLQFKF